MTETDMAMIKAGKRPGTWAQRGTVAVALVALAATAWQVAQAQPDGGPGHPGEHGGWAMHGGPGMPMGPGGLDGRGMDRLLDEVKATPEQRSRIQDILKAARQDLRAQHEAGAALHEKALPLFAQPTLDAAAAEALRQQMLAEHDRASKRMLQAMLDAAAVLTPEQRTQLGQRLQQRRDMMQRHRSEREALEGRQR